MCKTNLFKGKNGSSGKYEKKNQQFPNFKTNFIKIDQTRVFYQKSLNPVPSAPNPLYYIHYNVFQRIMPVTEYIKLIRTRIHIFLLENKAKTQECPYHYIREKKKKNYLFEKNKRKNLSTELME